MHSQPSLAHLTLRLGSSRGLGAVPYPALPLLHGPMSQSSARPSGALVSRCRRGCRASFCILCGAGSENTLGGGAGEHQELRRPASSLDRGWLVNRANWWYSPSVRMQSLQWGWPRTGGMGVTQSRTGCLLSQSSELLEQARSNHARDRPRPGAGSAPQGRAANHRHGQNSSCVGQRTLGENSWQGTTLLLPSSWQLRRCHRQSGMWLTLDKTVAEHCGGIPVPGAAWPGAVPLLAHTGAQRMHCFPHAI